MSQASSILNVFAWADHKPRQKYIINSQISRMSVLQKAIRSTYLVFLLDKRLKWIMDDENSQYIIFYRSPHWLIDSALSQTRYTNLRPRLSSYGAGTPGIWGRERTDRVRERGWERECFWGRKMCFLICFGYCYFRFLSSVSSVLKGTVHNSHKVNDCKKCICSRKDKRGPRYYPIIILISTSPPLCM